MFGLFQSRTSPVRRRVEELIAVRSSWIEWTIENGRREATLVVELEYDTDPASPDFRAEDYAKIAAAAAAAEAGEVAPARIRVVPRGQDT